MIGIRSRVVQIMYAVLSVLVVSQVATAGVYELKFPSLGRGQTAEACGSRIQAFAEQFARETLAVGTPAEILGAACVPSSIGREGSDGQLTYVAAERIATVTSDVGTAWGTDGHYRSWDSCLEGLMAERALMERLVGRSPFAAYCYQSNIASSPRFRARLDSIGARDIVKRSVDASWQMPLVDPSGVKRGILARAAMNGLEVVEFSLDRDGIGYRATVDYYSAQDRLRYLHAENGLEWRSLADCEASSAALASRWPVSEMTPIFSCSSARENEFYLVYLWFSSDPFDEDDFETKLMPQLYPSVAACESDARRIEEALIRGGERVLASQCGYADRHADIRLMVFLEVSASALPSPPP